MTPSANAKQRTAIWLILALVALATPTLAADRTVNAISDAPLLDRAFESLPVIAYVQAGPIVFIAVLLPTDSGQQPADSSQGADKDEGKTSVILEDGAPF